MSIVQNRNIKKQQKYVFIGPSEKLKAFRFFLQFSKYFTPTPSRYISYSKIFSLYNKNHFRGSTWFDYQNWGMRLLQKSKYPNMAKNSFYSSIRKVERFLFFFTVFEVKSTDSILKIAVMATFTYFNDSLVGSVLFMSISIHACQMMPQI